MIARRGRARRALWGALSVIGASAASGQITAGAAARGNDYSDGNNWLCRPGRRDACTVDLTTTVVAADGTLTREAMVADANPPIDCFYVYPTVSMELALNSDMALGPEQRGVAAAQLARFASVCRLYAPLYRQLTLVGIRRRILGAPMEAEQALAYGDVLNAWTYYLAHDNGGRGVVLIGHSQGATILAELIAREIDGKPIAARLVSALLPGTTIPVPQGRDVGGMFRSIRLCRSPSQFGCVIAYSSFRANAPPPPNAIFGQVATPGLVAACTNPAALGGGSGELHAYLGAHGSRSAGSANGAAGAWVAPPASITTPFVSVPGMLTGECVDNGHGSYLAVTVHGDPRGARARDIGGDVVVAGQVQAAWGLHLIDVNLAQGNLIDIVREQAAAYLAARSRR